MAADIFGGGETAPVVFLRLEQYDVYFGKEQQHQRHDRGETNAQTERDHILVRVVIDGHERDPNHQGSVHRETDKLCFVKIFRYISRFYSVKRTKSDEYKVESKRSGNSC